MKRSSWPAALTVLGFVCFLGGCSQAVLLRIFNHTDHEIFLLERTGGRMIPVPSGGEAVVQFAGVTKGSDHGFLIKDGIKELFYVTAIEREDKANGFYFQPQPAPRESRRSHGIGFEYFFEYSSTTEVFALHAFEDTIKSRIQPQPDGFPMRPKQTRE